MLDFNARRYCLLSGASFEASAPEARAPTENTSARPRLRRYVYLRELAERTSLSQKQIWHLVNAGKLDPPIRLHYRAFAWPCDYISTWLQARGLLL